jgi:hypothetical protein
MTGKGKGEEEKHSSYDGKVEHAVQIDVNDPNVAASRSSGKKAQERRGVVPKDPPKDESGK